MIFRNRSDHRRSACDLFWLEFLRDLCDLVCKNFQTISRKGIRTEGRKDHEDLMVVEREACIGASTVLEG